ncbi:MAG TPA: hypothetical protein VHV83_18660, partial [Armatimonadota bacterium]|nr:hypothetical protein [Armatimonadota bacterium]
VVVVPPSATWRPKTYELLQQFVEHGGTLIFAGELPSEIDCEPATAKWRALAMKSMTIPCSCVQIQAALDKVVPRSITLRDPDGSPVKETFMHTRVDGDQHIIFIVNNDPDHAQDYVLSLPGEKTLTVWDALSGKRVLAQTQPTGEQQRYVFTLPPAGSVLLVAESATIDSIYPEHRLPDLSSGTVCPLTNNWSFTRTEDNVLVLDRLQYSLDGGQTWSKRDLECRMRRTLAKHFGTTEALQWQPWVAIQKGLFIGKGGAVTLRYRFTSALYQPKAFFVMENLRYGALTINGMPVDTSHTSWQWDRGFGKVEITEYVIAGENTIDVRLHYDFLTAIEAAYIVGDFAVQLTSPYEGQIISEPTILPNGSWLEAGYPFYSGTIIYRTDFIAPTMTGRTFLRLIRASGILYHIRVNGQKVGSILSRPHVIELTDVLVPGTNMLEIEVVASRQNTFGPLHERDGEDHPYVNSAAFEEESVIREELSLYDYGLLDGAKLVISD